MVISLLLLLILISVVVRGEEDYCIKNHHDWYRNTTRINTTEKLCSLSFVELLSINTQSMIEPQNIGWVLCAQQYVSARLNLQIIQENQTTGIEKDCLFISDNLQRVCHNVSQLLFTNDMTKSLMKLYQFNQGLIYGKPCPSPHSSMADNNTFYYYQKPDIIALYNTENNMSNIYSVTKDLYRTQLFLVITCISQFILLAIASLFIIMLRNKKKRYAATLVREPSISDKDL